LKKHAQNQSLGNFPPTQNFKPSPFMKRRVFDEMDKKYNMLFSFILYINSLRPSVCLSVTEVLGGGGNRGPVEAAGF
jgi:hypothetical protein